MRIHTHFNVDLDATASVWAARTFIPGMKEAEVEFHPANWDGDMAKDDIGDAVIVDMACGIKGDKDEDGTIHSCFASLVSRLAPAEDQEALASLVAYVDAQDAHGHAVKHLAPGVAGDVAVLLSSTGINAVLRAFQARHPRNDALVCERMGEIFTGMLQAGRARMRAQAEAELAEVLPSGLVAVVRDSREFATNGILFEWGVRVIVYVDGCNIGLIRAGEEQLRMDHPDLKQVVEAAGESGEWFAHSAGFLFCRGSRKAPAKTSSAVDPTDLARVAEKLLA